VITSLNLTQRYTRDMFPWSMVTIWGRCRSNNGTVCLFYFINYKESCVLILIDKYPLHLDARSGEWGDHVTLQAVADAVWIISTCSCLFFFRLKDLMLFLKDIDFVFFVLKTFCQLLPLFDMHCDYSLPLVKPCPSLPVSP